MRNRIPPEAAVQQCRSLLASDHLNQAQVRTLCDNFGVAGEPTPSGYAGGKPYWTADKFRDWVETAKRVRGATFAPARQHRAAAPRTAAGRAARAVLTTTVAVERLVMVGGGPAVVDEVLLPEGAEHTGRVPFLDSHLRERIADVIGSVDEITTRGEELLGSLHFAAEGDAYRKVADGHVDSVSVGYINHDYIDIPPNIRRVVKGHTFEAKSKPVRVVTRWSLLEVSLVAIPADPYAKITLPAHDSERQTAMTIATRGGGPAIHSANTVTGGHTVGEIASAAMLKLGMTNPDQYRVEQTGKSFVRMAPSSLFEHEAERGVGLAEMRWQDLFKLAGRLDGLDCEFASDTWWRYHAGRGLSTGAGQLFTAIVGAAFVAGFDSIADPTAGWVSEGTVPTLRKTPRVRTPGGIMRRRTRGGTADSMPVATPGEDAKLIEYASRWSLSQSDVIDGDLGDLRNVGPYVMGQAAARVRADAVAAVLLANETMRDGTALFHSDHGNLLTGSALADGALESAAAAMAAQQEEGASLNLNGRFLVVPPELSRTAGKLCRDAVVDWSDATPPAVPRVDGRLSNGIEDPLTGESLAGSASTWYLAAADGQNGIEVVYLEGTGGKPSFRSGELDAFTWGYWVDCTHYVGAHALDWRGIVKATA